MTELTLCPFCGSKNTKCIYEYEFNGEALRSGGNLRHVCLNCQKEFDAIDIAYRSTMYYESELNNFIKETQEKTTFIENGKIIKTELGGDIMTFWLEIEFDVGVCGFGGYALDNYDEKIWDGDLYCTDMYYYSKNLKMNNSKKQQVGAEIGEFRMDNLNAFWQEIREPTGMLQ